MSILFRYTLFAVVATFANIAVQDLASSLNTSFYPFFISIGLGTFVGLAVKYILDKKYIFNFQSQGILHDGRTFALYTLMGIATTAVFWVTEAGFYYYFHTRTMKYVGAIIGLSIGYYVKYHLDKKYVFSQNS